MWSSVDYHSCIQKMVMSLDSKSGSRNNFSTGEPLLLLLASNLLLLREKMNARSCRGSTACPTHHKSFLQNQNLSPLSTPSLSSCSRRYKPSLTQKSHPQVKKAPGTRCVRTGKFAVVKWRKAKGAQISKAWIIHIHSKLEIEKKAPWNSNIKR